MQLAPPILWDEQSEAERIRAELPLDESILQRNCPVIPMYASAPPVCVVDGDISVRETLHRLLNEKGIRVESYGSAMAFLTRQNRELPSCLVVDVDLPGMNGLNLLSELTRRETPIPTIILSSRNDVSLSVRAIKAGALDFLTQPFDPEELLGAIEEGMLMREFTDAHCSNDSQDPNTKGIVGTGNAYRMLMNRIKKVAPTDSTVLIEGEPGTGKELI